VYKFRQPLYCLVGIVLVGYGLEDWGIGFDAYPGQEICFSSTASRPVLRPTQLLSMGFEEFFSRGKGTEV
jgi:hypothetical protein